VAEQDLRAAEEWFVDHGLPYFVDHIRDGVRARLGRSRVIGVTTVALVLAAVVGVLLGWSSGTVSAGLTAGLATVIVVWLLYAARALKVWMIARWAVNRAFASLELLFPLATRALPLLLLFVTFLFINTEVWMVASRLDGGILWGTVLLFAAVAVGFLVVRLIEELDRVDDEIGREELGERADIVGLQKTNLVLVLLINQALQVLLLALAVFLFFVVFGAVAMDKEVLEIWIEEDLNYPWGVRPISIELLQVSVFLAAFSGLYFAVYAINDENYRREFLTEVLGELEQALKMRVGYLLQRD
jgi:MFS family permease